MTQSAKSTSSVDWKRRYAELLEQQELQQLRYKRKQDLLVDALLKVSHYGRDLDDIADERLLALRALLRQGNFKNVDLAQIVKALEQLGSCVDTRNNKRQEVVHQLHSLTKQTIAMASAADVQQQLHELKQSIEATPVGFSSLAKHLNSLSQLQVAATKNRRTGQSILQRWLGSVASNSDEPKAFSLDTVSDYLSRLLQEIEHGSEMQGTFEVAQELLKDGLSLDNIDVAVQSVAEVVLAAVASDRLEMSTYLSEMNERLQNATLNLSDSQSLFMQEVQLQEQFGRAMQSSVRGLRNQVATGLDLDRIKQDLDQSLNGMEQVISDNQQEAGTLHSQLSKQLESLVVQAKELEQQGEVAKRKAVEQQQRALTDSLTKLPNREAYEEAAAREVQRWQRYGRPLCLAVCDIDLFKAVNDSYGHSAGDEVLQQIAGLLKERLRGSDFLARYGGEEFVVLLPETDREQAEFVMQNVRELIEQSRLKHDKKLIDVTISVGLADFRGKDILQSAFTRADRALYQAKLNGRNRVEFALD